MKPVKHISFDVWGTIFKGNPAYSQARAEIISTIWLSDTHSNEQIETVKSAFKEVKRTVDQWEDWTLRATPNEFRQLMVLEKIMPECKDKMGILKSPQWQSLFHELALEHPPILIHESIKQVFKFCKEHNIHRSIFSNSALLNARTMRCILHDKHGLEWESDYFSEEKGHHKPSPLAFFDVWKEGGSKVMEFMMHVGNSMEHDIIPANNFGMQHHIITRPEHWVNLKNRLEISCNDW